MAAEAAAQAENANTASGKAAEAASHAVLSARDAGRFADDATAAELALAQAGTAAERRSAELALEAANQGARDMASQAETYRNSASDRENVANSYARGAQQKFDDLLTPLPLHMGEDALTTRNWLVCGGEYVGFGIGLCAAVRLEATKMDDGDPALYKIAMRIRNLSGLFGSYAGSILTGIGLSYLGTDPRELHDIEGKCEPGLANSVCAAQWGLAVGHPHAKMPNGIGTVGMKIFTHGVQGGIASTCATDLPNLDPAVDQPSNPNGLYMNDCDASASSFALEDWSTWTTFNFYANAPVYFNHTQLSLRVQNGYQGGSTACIFTGSSGTTLDNECMPEEMTPTTTVPEPITMVLVGSGLAGIGALNRRRRRLGVVQEDAA
jgi:hypothetical protein